MTIETVYLSQKNKDQLIKIKRATGIQNWNILCRWAFCLSLADKTLPSNIPDKNGHAIEISWKVFGGNDHAIYLALLVFRCKKENSLINKEILTNQLHLHLNRGIRSLTEKLRNKGIGELFKCQILSNVKLKG